MNMHNVAISFHELQSLIMANANTAVQLSQGISNGQSNPKDVIGYLERALKLANELNVQWEIMSSKKPVVAPDPTSQENT